MGNDDSKKLSRRKFLANTAMSAVGVGVGLPIMAAKSPGAKPANVAVQHKAHSHVVKPNTEGSVVKVDMPGKMGPERDMGGWPNLVEVANLAIKHFNEICDPEQGYVPYVGGSLGYKIPAFQHNRWDWIEVLPYSLIGRIAARRLTGTKRAKRSKSASGNYCFQLSTTWMVSPIRATQRVGANQPTFVFGNRAG
jgi:hypothetical protein